MIVLIFSCVVLSIVNKTRIKNDLKETDGVTDRNGLMDRALLPACTIQIPLVHFNANKSSQLPRLYNLYHFDKQKFIKQILTMAVQTRRQKKLQAEPQIDAVVVVRSSKTTTRNFSTKKLRKQSRRTVQASTIQPHHQSSVGNEETVTVTVGSASSTRRVATRSTTNAGTAPQVPPQTRHHRRSHATSHRWLVSSCWFFLVTLLLLLVPLSPVPRFTPQILIQVQLTTVGMAELHRFRKARATAVSLVHFRLVEKREERKRREEAEKQQERKRREEAEKQQGRKRREEAEKQVERILQAKDSYSTLNVTPTATTKEIQKAYRSLARVVHPDKSGADPQRTAEAFRKIEEAHAWLTDKPSQRREQWQPPPEPQQQQDLVRVYLLLLFLFLFVVALIANVVAQIMFAY